MLVVTVRVDVPLFAVSAHIGSNQDIADKIGCYYGVAEKRVWCDRSAADGDSSFLAFTFLDFIPNENMLTAEHTKAAFGDLLTDSLKQSLSVSMLKHTRSPASESQP